MNAKIEWLPVGDGELFFEMRHHIQFMAENRFPGVVNVGETDRVYAARAINTILYPDTDTNLWPLETKLCWRAQRDVEITVTCALCGIALTHIDPQQKRFAYGRDYYLCTAPGCNNDTFFFSVGPLNERKYFVDVPSQMNQMSQSLFRDIAGTDYFLQTETTDVHVHSVVVGVVCEPLKNMCREAARDNRRSIDFTEWKTETVMELKRYLYLGTWRRSCDDTAYELVRLADMLLLDGLKDSAMRNLHLTEDNVCSVLANISLLRATEIGIEMCHRFIRDNVEAVTESEGWASLLNGNPDVVASVVMYLARS